MNTLTFVAAFEDEGAAAVIADSSVCDILVNPPGLANLVAIVAVRALPPPAP